MSTGLGSVKTRARNVTTINPIWLAENPKRLARARDVFTTFFDLYQFSELSFRQRNIIQMPLVRCTRKLARNFDVPG